MFSENAPNRIPTAFRTAPHPHGHFTNFGGGSVSVQPRKPFASCRMTMSPPKPITFDELKRDLPFNEWDIWLQSRLADLRSTREGRKHLRFDTGPMKVVKEEIIPTLLLLERRFKGEEILATF